MARGDQVHLLLQIAADTGRMPAGSGPIWEEAAAVLHNQELEWVLSNYLSLILQTLHQN